MKGSVCLRGCYCMVVDSSSVHLLQSVHLLGGLWLGMSCLQLSGPPTKLVNLISSHPPNYLQAEALKQLLADRLEWDFDLEILREEGSDEDGPVVVDL